MEQTGNRLDPRAKTAWRIQTALVAVPLFFVSCSSQADSASLMARF